MENRDYIKSQFKQYLNGQLSAEEARELLHFLQSSPDDGFVESLIEDSLDHPIAAAMADDFSLGKQLEESRKLIHQRISGNVVNEQSNIRSIWRKATTVAAAVAVFLIGYYVVRPNEKMEMVTVKVSNGSIKTITLPDSSKVWLNAGSTLQYPVHFAGNNRTVLLKNGEAFFDVTHDPARPFQVQTGSLSATVYGTSFNVKSFKNDISAGIRVKTGRVGIVDRQISGSTVMLDAGEGVRIDRRAHTISKISVASAEIGQWRNNTLNFSGEPFSEVVHALERRYDVKISIRKPSLQDEKITLKVTDEPLESVLQVLSLSNNFKYSIHEKSVIVN